MNDYEKECKSCSKEITDKVNVTRFIDKLDSYFKTNDLEGAKHHLEYWTKFAKEVNDERGLLSVLNESIGFYRRTKDNEMAFKSVQEALELLEHLGMKNQVSGATILLNAATTLNAVGKAEVGLPLYDVVEKVYNDHHMEDTFEYASLLNNKATSLNSLLRYDEAEKCYDEAIEVLKKEGCHDGDIAVSLISLAHLYFDRDTDYERVEKTLDLAWEYLNSEKLAHDAMYAYILTKCAPSLKYFKREMEAEALEEIAKEIYGER